MMRFLFVLLLVLDVLHLSAQDFRIEVLSTPTIKIGGKVCKVNSVFKANQKIEWSNEKQSMMVEDIKTHRPYHFTKSSFSQKKVKSVSEYFNVTKPLSTRAFKSSYTYLEGKRDGISSEKRIALVIGNSNYDHLSFLAEGINDADSIAYVLSFLGFDTFLFYDASDATFNDIVQLFTNKASAYETALFFYSGYIKRKNMKDYFVNIDSMEPILRDTIPEYLSLNALNGIVAKTGCSNTVFVYNAFNSTGDDILNPPFTPLNSLTLGFSSVPLNIGLQATNSVIIKDLIRALRTKSTRNISLLIKNFADSLSSLGNSPTNTLRFCEKGERF